MDGTCTNTSPGPLEKLAEDLCLLLEKQITCAREGNLLQCERLGASAGQTVGQIARLLQDGSALSQGSRASLQKLYGELILALKAESNSASENLRQLRQFRKAITTYANRVS